MEHDLICHRVRPRTQLCYDLCFILEDNIYVEEAGLEFHSKSSLTVTQNPKQQFPHVPEPGHRGFISVWQRELGLPNWGLSGQNLRISHVLFWSDFVLYSN